MTDPERISKRGVGLAAHLLRAGAAERPDDARVERALRALGVSGVVLSTSAVASGAKVTNAATAGAGAGAGGVGGVAASAGGAAKVVTASLFVKWIGIGAVGGVGLAGAAMVATAPSPATPPVVTASAPEPRVRVEPAPAAPVAEAAPPSVVADAPAPAAPPAAPPPAAPRVSVAEPQAAPPDPDPGVPLAAEVAFVDRARSQLAAGQAEQGLAMLESYERQFPEARLLPEVLFLRLETSQRLGHAAEARAAAERLVDGFPKSPHASRARQLLGQ